MRQVTETVPSSPNAPYFAAFVANSCRIITNGVASAGGSTKSGPSMVTRPSRMRVTTPAGALDDGNLGALPVALYKEVMRLRKGEQAIFELFMASGLVAPCSVWRAIAMMTASVFFTRCDSSPIKRKWCDAGLGFADVLNDRHKPGRRDGLPAPVKNALQGPAAIGPGVCPPS